MFRSLCKVKERKIQWGSEYRSFEKTETFEYQTFLSLNFKWFGIQRFGLSAIHVLCTRPTIPILDYYIRKQYGVYLSSFQMAFEYQTI